MLIYQNKTIIDTTLLVNYFINKKYNNNYVFAKELYTILSFDEYMDIYRLFRDRGLIYGYSMNQIEFERFKI